MPVKFFSKLKPTEKILFYITSIVFVIMLFTVFFVYPSLDKISDLETEILKERKSIESDLKIAGYKEQVQTEREKLSKFFAQEKEEELIRSNFQQALSKYIQKSNLELSKNNPDKALQRDRYIEYITNIECTGELKDVISFIHHLNTSDEMLKVQSVRLAPKRGAGDTISVSMSIAKMVIFPDLATSDEAPKK